MRNLIATMMLLSAITASVGTSAQVHPITYGAGGVYTNNNFYKDYVGLLFDVIIPSSLAGPKNYTTSAGPAGWGGSVVAPMLNKQIIMPPGDSLCTMPISISMSGKIGLVYRGGGVEFSAKALAVQTAGAIACVIVNNVPGGPVSMAAGAVGGSVTIPVFMISKADGDAMDLAYLAGTTITMSISGWGRNHQNDLGFVPQGIAGWSNYATPANQLFPAVTDMAYKGLSGAFIANYGTHLATNVKVRDTLRYTPTTGSPTVLHAGVTANLSSFPPVDSIYAMLGTSEYSFAPPSLSTGRYDLKYNIVSDSADQYSADNTVTSSYYATDSVYSKGRYDFVNNVPSVGISYTTGGGFVDFLWGPMYYVAHGGTALSSAQFSLSEGTTGVPMSIPTVVVHAFKWSDGSASLPADGLVQNGELFHVASGIYSFTATDTSGDVFKVNMRDAVTGDIVMLDAASWYYIAVEVPAGLFLGADGQTSPYPRVYGRSHVSGTTDYSSVLVAGGISDLSATPAQASPPCAFPGTFFVNSIDSFNFARQKGVIPAVAMIVFNNPITLISGPSPVCVGDAPVYTNPVSGGTWSSSSMAVGTIGSSTGAFTPISAGTTVITYATSSTVYGTMTVTVNDLPEATVTGPISVCVGSTITLTPAVAGGTWNSLTTSTATVASGVVTGVAAGAGTIEYFVSNTCGIATTSTNITVHALPTPAITVSGLTLGTTVTYTGYQWLSGGSPISGATGVTYDVTADGSYAVTVTDANGCTATSAAVVVTVPTGGISDVNAGTSVLLYPNPTSGAFSIHVATAGRLQVFALDGRKIMSCEVNAGTAQISLPAGTAEGLYTCKFEGGNGTVIVTRLICKK